MTDELLKKYENDIAKYQTQLRQMYQQKQLVEMNIQRVEGVIAYIIGEQEALKKSIQSPPQKSEG